jgi:hypothetical protein
MAGGDCSQVRPSNKVGEDTTLELAIATSGGDDEEIIWFSSQILVMSEWLFGHFWVF